VNLVSVLLRHAADRPDAPALVEGERVVSYAELEGLAAEAASGLAKLGIAPGDRVAIASHNDVAFVTAYLGVLWAGAVAVPLNPLAPGSVLTAQTRRVGADRLLCGSGTEDLLGLAGAVAIADLLGGGRVAAEAERDDAELAVLLFTSGTAGAPRAAMLTHGNLEANIGQVQEHPGLRVGTDDVGLGALPFFHVFGLNVALGVGLQAGACTVLLDHFDAARAVELVRVHGVTILAGVPTMFDSILELPDQLASPASFSSVRRAVSGAAELPLALAEAFRERFGVTIHEGYGLTEAAPIVSTTAVEHAPRFGSIGPPLPGIEVRLVGDDGEDVVAGDPGEIWVRGPNVFAGYWDDPEATARVLVDGWLRTGDVAVVDDEGFLSLVDRKKDLIIVSGFNVFPAEVEDALLAHDGIADAAVVGVPHPRTGEAVAAWVVPEPGATLTVDGVREHAARHLARYKVPATVEIVPELPRNEAGKLLRRELVPRDA
jgi:long-chain acyl-CoA synthetase